MDALIINPDLESRIRLRQAMNYVPEFRIVKVVSTLAEALERLFAGERFGSLFISTLFGRSIVTEFMTKSRETPGGKGCACILTLSGSAKAGEIAEDLCNGADGFLVEPFSVDSLQKIHRIAVRVKRQYMAARQRQGIRLLLQEAADGIDHHAFTLSRFPDAQCPGSLAKIRRSLEQIAACAEEAYVDALEDFFTGINRPRQPAYRGASARLRKKFGFSDTSSLPGRLAGILERSRTAKLLLMTALPFGFTFQALFSIITA